MNIHSELPTIYRANRAHIHASKDLGDIESISQQNFTRLRSQLRQGDVYIDSCRVIPKSKPAECAQLLTKEETDLFRLLTENFRFKHATPHLESIRNEGNVLKTLSQREAQGAQIGNRRTGSGTHYDRWVFMTMGIGDHATPYQTGTEGEILLDPKNYPLRRFWVSTHRDDFFSNSVYDRMSIGGTSVEISHDQTTNTKTYTYRRKDGAEFRRTVSFKDEIYASGQVLGAIAFELILHLRFIGDPYRSDLLHSKQSDEQKCKRLGALMACLMPSGSSPEVKIPHQLNLQDPAITIKQPPKRYALSSDLNNILRFFSAKTFKDYDLNVPFVDGVYPLERYIANYASHEGPGWVQSFEELLAAGASMEWRRLDGRLPSISTRIPPGNLRIILNTFCVNQNDPMIMQQVQLGGRFSGIKLTNHNAFPDVIKEILKHTPGLKSKSAQLLTWASRYVPYVIPHLLKAGVDGKAAYPKSATPLMILAENGSEVLDLLIAEGADLHKRFETSHASSCEGYTALHFARANGHEDAVASLLKAGADPNAKASSGEPAILGSETEKYPIQHRGVVAIITGGGYVIAAHKRNEIGGVTKKLYFPGGFVGLNDETPVISLVREVKEETTLDLQPLIDAGKVVPKLVHTYKKVGINEETHYTTYFYHIEIGDHLKNEALFAEDDLASLHKCKIDSLLQNPTKLVQSNHHLLRVIQGEPCAELVDHWHTIELEGERMLRIAAKEGNLERVRELLDADVPVQPLHHRFLDALDHASEQGHLSIVELLLERGAKLKRGDAEYLIDMQTILRLRLYTYRACTSLLYAAQAGRNETVKRLLQEAIILPSDKFMAAQCAAAGGSLETTLALMTADLSESYTVFLNAIVAGKSEVVARLMKDYPFTVDQLTDAYAEAAIAGHIEVMNLFESSRSYLDNALVRVVEYCRAGYRKTVSKEIVEWLLEKGASVTFTKARRKHHYTGQSALSEIASERYMEGYRDVLPIFAKYHLREQIQKKTSVAPLSIEVKVDEKGKKTIHCNYANENDAKALAKLTKATVRNENNVWYVRLGEIRCKDLFKGDEDPLNVFESI